MRRKRRPARGAVLVEYAFLLVAFGIPVAMAFVTAGGKMYQQYKDAKAAILRPLP
jgi:hypothetical protein